MSMAWQYIVELLQYLCAGMLIAVLVEQLR